MIKGLIKYIGLSNETPWGVMKFISVAKEFNLPRVVSIQNPYSLLNRSFEAGLSEIAINEKVGSSSLFSISWWSIKWKILKW